MSLELTHKKTTSIEVVFLLLSNNYFIIFPRYTPEFYS